MARLLKCFEEECIHGDNTEMSSNLHHHEQDLSTPSVLILPLCQVDRCFNTGDIKLVKAVGTYTAKVQHF